MDSPAGTRGPDHEVVAPQQIRESIRVHRLHIGDDRVSTGVDHVGLVLRIADHGIHMVALGVQQWDQVQGDLAVPADQRNVHGGSQPRGSDASHPPTNDNRTSLRGLSPFGSTSTMLCQVPRAKPPSSTGTVRLGATKAGMT